MLAWFLGVRYLRRRRAAWLAVAAITLTIAVSIMVLGVAQGAVELTRLQVRSHEADLTVLARKYHRDSEQMRDNLRLPGITTVTPMAQGYILLQGQDGTAIPAQIDGVDMKAEWEAGRLHGKNLHPEPVFDLTPVPLPADARGTGLLTPAWRQRLASAGLDVAAGFGVGCLPMPPRSRLLPGVIVGRELMYMHGLRPGHTAVLVGLDPNGGPPPRERVEISDTIGTGLLEVDKLAVIAPLPQTRRLLDLPAETVQGWRLSAAPGENLSQLKAQLTSNNGLLTQDWMQRRGSFVKSLEQQTVIMAVVMILVQIIVVFIVYAVFSTLVAEKRQDLGILRGLGARRGDLAGAFFIAGFLACLIGGGLGWLVGWVGLALLNPLSEALGVPLFPQEIFYTASAPLSFDPWLPLFFIVTQTVIALVAVSYPAWQATRVDPIASLRADI